MCAVDVYDKDHVTMHDDASSVGGRPIPSMSYKEACISIGHTIRFIDNCIQPFEDNFDNIIMTYKGKICELFKKKIASSKKI